MDDFGFVPDEDLGFTADKPTSVSDDFGFVPDEPKARPQPVASNAAGPGASVIPGAESYTSNPPKETEDTLLQKLKGAYVEAPLSLVAGAVSPLAALVGGTVQSLGQAGMGQLPDWKANVEKINEALTPEPKTQTGQMFAEKVLAPLGEGMMALGPNPMAMSARGIRNAANVRRAMKEPLERSRVTAVDDVIAAKKAAAAAPEGAGVWNPEMGPTPAGAEMQGPRAPMEGPVIPDQFQRDLFAEDKGGMNVKPQQAGAGPLPAEVRGELANKRQQSLDFGLAPDTLQVTREGVAIPAGQADIPLMARNAQMDAQIATLDAQRAAQQAAEFEALSKGENGSLFESTGEGLASPYDAGLVGTTEPITPARQARQMGFEFKGGEPIAVTPEGTAGVKMNEHAVKAQMEQRAAVEQARAEAAAKLAKQAEDDFYAKRASQMENAEQQALRETENQLDLFGDNVTTGPIPKTPFDRSVAAAKAESPKRWFTASPEAGRTKSFGLAEQAARTNADAQRYGPGQYIAESRDFSSVYGGPNGRMYEVEAPFQRAFDASKPSNEKIYQQLVEQHGSRTGANLALQREGYDAITFTSPRGDKLANIFNEKPLKDIGPAREKVAEQLLTLQEYEPGKPVRSLANRQKGKQGGFIRLPFGSKPGVNYLEKMAAFKDKMGNFLVDDRTPAQLLEAIKGQPDMSKVSDFNFTKGGDYTVARTNNPLVKYGVDAYKEADGRIKAQQEAYVHNIYTPMLRKLSKEEFTDVWAVLQKMQKEKIVLSDQELTNAGFNLRERDAIKTHQTMMEEFLPKANEAMEAIGMKPITPEVAHLATKLGGNFRRVMTKEIINPDGTKSHQIVGALGDTTRSGLAKQVAKFQELYPDTLAGPEKTMTKRGERGMGDLMETLNFLGSKDPLVAEFVQRSNEVLNGDVLNHRGFKTHTMPKKGVPGMPGNKPWEDAYTNAVEGFESQVKYFNKVIEMAELAKADAKVKPLLDPSAIDMPNAQAYLRKYRDMAMGRNPTAIGRAVDQGLAGLVDATNGWSTHLGEGLNVGRRLTNMKLLSLDPAFLFSQVIQPMRAMPELAQLIRSRGGKVGLAGETSMMKGFADMVKHTYKMDLDPITKGAAEFADEHHVYSGDLLEASNNVRNTAWGVVNNALQKPAGVIEQGTRKLMYFTMVDLLHKNGVTVKEGLYQAAAKLTDMGMNNYSAMESPIAFQNAGALGKAPYNLASYKWNEISRIAMMGREAMRNPTSAKAWAPVMTSLLMQVTTAGILGTIAFKEADWLTEQISKALGKPTSLTKILLDHGDKKLVGPITVNDAAYGLGNTANVDMTNRLGMGPIIGTGPSDILMPGASAVGQAAGSALDLGKSLATNTNIPYNAKKAVIDILPGGKLMEPVFFSKKNKFGQYDVLNREKVEESVTRTPTENVMKGFGFTSARESRRKTGEYELQKQNMFFGDKRKAALEQIGQALYGGEDWRVNVNNTDNKADINKETIGRLAKKWVDAGGNADNLEPTIEQMAVNQRVAADIRAAIKTAEGKDVNKMKRRFNRETQ